LEAPVPRCNYPIDGDRCWLAPGHVGDHTPARERGTVTIIDDPAADIRSTPPTGASLTMRSSRPAEHELNPFDDDDHQARAALQPGAEPYASPPPPEYQLVVIIRAAERDALRTAAGRVQQAINADRGLEAMTFETTDLTEAPGRLTFNQLERLYTSAILYEHRVDRIITEERDAAMEAIDAAARVLAYRAPAVIG
jgi:hypothetical protein